MQLICTDHDRTPPVATIEVARQVVYTSETVLSGTPDLVALVVTEVGAYRQDPCCAAGAYARWLCSAAWRERAAGI